MTGGLPLCVGGFPWLGPSVAGAACPGSYFS